jgi:hypothetical protein
VREVMLSTGAVQVIEDMIVSLAEQAASAATVVGEPARDVLERLVVAATARAT